MFLGDPRLCNISLRLYPLAIWQFLLFNQTMYFVKLNMEKGKFIRAQKEFSFMNFNKNSEELVTELKRN